MKTPQTKPKTKQASEHTQRNGTSFSLRQEPDPQAAVQEEQADHSHRGHTEEGGQHQGESPGGEHLSQKVPGDQLHLRQAAHRPQAQADAGGDPADRPGDPTQQGHYGARHQGVPQPQCVHVHDFARDQALRVEQDKSELE